MPWPSIDPGSMVHWVQFLKQTEVDDASGSAVVMAPFLSAWAEIEPVRGIDMLRSGQDVTQLDLTLRIRYQTGLQPNMQVRAGGSTYIIQSIENPGKRNVLLVLNCLALALNV